METPEGAVIKENAGAEALMTFLQAWGRVGVGGTGVTQSPVH